MSSMTPTRRFPILEKLGLAENEAMIYELLLEHGSLGAREVTELAGIGRGNVYNYLMSLKRRGLVIPIEGKRTTFQPVDPNALRSLLAATIERTRELESSYAGAVREMESAYALAIGRPSVEVFEGIEGAKRALYDSLESKTDILTYFDVSALSNGPMAKVNRAYVKRRIEQKIHKRLIVADTPEAHAFFEKQNTPYTVVAYVSDFPEGHATGMEMYDGTVSYVLLKSGRRISMLVRDAGVYELHRLHFEYLWSRAREVVDYAARRAMEVVTGSVSKTT